MGNANQTVTYGESGTKVTAVPNDGYRFVKWSDITETPERQDINITADKTVTAIFEKQTFTLNYVAGAGGTIDGEAEQQVKYAELS